MTAVEIALPIEPKRDRYGRYLIPHPDTGKETSWTRVTTLADTLDDRFNLERWKLRTCVAGLVARPDLFALAAAQHDNRDALNKTLDKAIEAGKGSAGANMGTALHKACERIDLGDTTFTLPGVNAADLDAYRTLRATTGATPHLLPDGRPGIEVIVIVPELQVAGTFDRLLDIPGQHLPVIDDIKTGDSAIEWAMTSIAIQLAAYAHATHIWNPATGELTAMPRVNQTVAYVTHLPAGKASASMWEVDIAAGWEAAQHALWVRKWRNRKNDLARLAGIPTVSASPAASDGPAPVTAGNVTGAEVDLFGDPVQGEGGASVGSLTPQIVASPSRPEPVADLFDGLPGEKPAANVADVAREYTAPKVVLPDDIFADTTTPKPSAPPTRRDNLAGRIERLKTIPGAEARLTILWPRSGDAEMPTLTNRHYEHTAAELDVLDKVVSEVEKQHEAPFDPPPAPPPTPKPATTPAARALAIAEGPLLDPDDIRALKTQLDALELGPQAWVASIIKACGQARRPLNMRDKPTTRRYAIVRALLMWATHVGPDDGPLLLGVETVTGLHRDTIGVSVGSMSIEEAGRLVELAWALDAGDIHHYLATGEDGDSHLMFVGDLAPFKPAVTT